MSLLSPSICGRKLRTTNVIERCFVEVRRRTRPMVFFVNIHSVTELSFPSFSDLMEIGKTAPLSFYTRSLTSPRPVRSLTFSRGGHSITLQNQDE